jgi:4-hydroxy-3-methylbut-2-en-1-yl diphosphate synthase IspG/GcpE
MLYAHQEAAAAPRKPYSCPICGKKKASVLAVLQHAHEAHRKPEHIEAVAAWWVERAKEKAQREPGQ